MDVPCPILRSRQDPDTHKWVDGRCGAEATHLVMIGQGDPPPLFLVCEECVEALRSVRSDVRQP